MRARIRKIMFFQITIAHSGDILFLEPRFSWFQF